MRWFAAWALFWIGHVIYLVFDQWLRIGMRWPIYRAYNWFMVTSGDIQGAGAGPWRSVDPNPLLGRESE